MARYGEVWHLKPWERFPTFFRRVASFRARTANLYIAGRAALHAAPHTGVEDGLTDPDEVPEPGKEAITRPGDLWLLGRHRLLCGDATNPDTIDLVMDGECADLLLTDPPYGVAYVGKTADALTIANDTMDPDVYRRFLADAFAAAALHLRPGGSFYLWHADTAGLPTRLACAEAGLTVRQCLVWVKSVLVLGRQDYQWRHEPCLYGWAEGATHTWLSDRTQTTVLQFDKPARSADHPTMKPVALFVYLIQNSVRPSLVGLDDPQTDESARSLSQCATREGILAGAVLGLAGPGTKISGIMPCTVIRPGDVADTILDRDKHPEWNGERTKMVYTFPTNDKLWKQYAELRAESLRQGHEGEEATAFYSANREAMDRGSHVAWPERFNPDELSALQHAMNLRLRDEAAFCAEYQNEPLPAIAAGEGELTAEQIAGKLNRLARGLVPLAGQHVTLFIDVQGTLLYWVATAWADDFTGAVLDYGTFPDQHRAYFTLRDAQRTLATATGVVGLEGSIFAGLKKLTYTLLGRTWPREDGSELKASRCFVDANWGASTEVVYQFCRQSTYASLLTPSHGRYVGAASMPFSEYRRQQGNRVGHNWRVPVLQGRSVRHVVYDTNYWKSFVHARLAVPAGEKGCLSLFGEKAEGHRLFAEQITSEYRIKTEGRGRTVDEWRVRPNGGDNHWFDCLVGCAVAASMEGSALMEHTPALKPSQKPSSYPRSTEKT